MTPDQEKALRAELAHMASSRDGWRNVAEQKEAVQQVQDARIASLRTALAAAQGALEWAATVFDDIGRPKNAAKLRALNTSGKPGDGERAVLKVQIEHMVNRFLAWKLPADFAPDAGISFKATFNEHTPFPARHEPVGTNLFTATQAEAMVRHMVEGMPAGEPGKPGGEAPFLSVPLPPIIPSKAISHAELAAALERISPTPRSAEDDADTPEPGGEAQAEGASYLEDAIEEVAAELAPAPPEGHPAPEGDEK